MIRSASVELERQVAEQGLRGFQLLQQPLPVLGNAALDQRHLQRLARLASVQSRPVSSAVDGARDGEDGKTGQPGPVRARDEDGQGPGTERHDQRQAVHAGDRRPRGQRPVDLAVAQAQPGEAAEQPAAHPLHGHPGGGQHGQELPGGLLARDQPREDAPGRQVHGHQQDQRGAQRDRDGRDDAAEVVDADVEPVGARRERADAEPEAPQGPLPPGLALDQQEEERHQQRREPPVAERREAERECGAGGCRHETPACCQQATDQRLAYRTTRDDARRTGAMRRGIMPRPRRRRRPRPRRGPA